MIEPGKSLRTVRSYVVRGGRMTAGQQRAFAELWPLFGLDFQPLLLDPARLFPGVAPLTLEIGFGNGAHLLARAAAEPDRNFLGVEVHRPGVGAVLLAAAAGGLRNLRLICHDAVEVLTHQIAPGLLDELEILFPDPWHKTRHHKRRLIQPQFLKVAAVRLRPGGTLHLATDWQAYAEHMHEVLTGCALLENAVPESRYAARDANRVATRFERRGEQLGHTVYELRWRRVIAASQ